jgi:putative PIN family toxin of toxin-antitoxin system
MSKVRAVLDTNILVSALLSPLGNPAKIYRMFLTGSLDLVISVGIFEEYEAVLHRPQLKIPTVDADKVLAAIRQHAETVYPTPSDAAMPDEDDRVFFDTAKTSGVYLVTGNTKHFPQKPFVLTPREFMSMDMGDKAHAKKR